VESVDADCYRRTITVGDRHGVIEVAPLASALEVYIRFPDQRVIPAIADRIRAMFDLAADPAAIGRRLRSDPLLRDPLGSHPGIRVPGAWDPFELAVRAILGQQVSVRGATTIAGRIAAMFGSPAAESNGLCRLSPTPAQLAAADLERAGVMPSRAETIRELARRVRDSGELALSSLAGVPGIGPWTVGYVAMRAFGDRDAFPSGDLVLRRVTGQRTARALEARSNRWRPYRAYAVMLLWQRTE
jgi:AraC family transcriptional regulator of adaptative response / DNA-3-methyladenine glycosylase II